MVEHANRALRAVPTWPLYLLGLAPAVWWFAAAFGNRLGADPVQALEHGLGLLALQFLVAALAVTPLRELTGITLVRFRRAIGLLAFAYAVLHLGVWLVLDRQLDWPRIAADLVKRPYIILGMAAFLMLVPLAATSFDRAIRRMGPVRWRRLHRLAYPATALAAIHFLWLVKAWPLEPILYVAAVVVLLGYRALPTRLRRPPPRTRQQPA
jgi:sulfoxide reductase heme-binding subunit YedZ